MAHDSETQVVVDRVVPGSAAERAGLQPGDVILEYNDTAIRKREDIDTGTTEGASSVKMIIRRDGKEITLRVPGGKLGLYLRTVYR